jgi:hypothetical protein
MFVPCNNRITRAVMPGLIPPIEVVVFIATIALFIVGARHLFSRNRAAAIVLIFPLVYTAVFCIVNPLMFPWYIVPLAPFVVFGVVAGFFATADRLGTRRNAALCTSVILLTLLTGFLAYRKLTTLSDVKEQRFRDLALLVREHSGGHGMIAAPEVGAIGYFSEMRMLDTAGIVSPEALPYLTGEHLPIPPELIADYRPDYLVSTDLFLEVGPEGERVIDLEIFRQKYVLLAEIDEELPKMKVKSFRAYHRIGSMSSAPE